MTTERQPRTIPNPFWCDRCEGRGYLVTDAEWEPYAVQCPECDCDRVREEEEAERRAEERHRLENEAMAEHFRKRPHG